MKRLFRGAGGGGITLKFCLKWEAGFLTFNLRPNTPEQTVFSKSFEQNIIKHVDLRKNWLYFVNNCSIQKWLFAKDVHPKKSLLVIFLDSGRPEEHFLTIFRERAALIKSSLFLNLRSNSRWNIWKNSQFFCKSICFLFKTTRENGLFGRVRSQIEGKKTSFSFQIKFKSNDPSPRTPT